MDRGVKIVLACGVLVGGTVIALLFRHQSPTTSPPAPGSGGQLVLRDRIRPNSAQPPATDDPRTRGRMSWPRDSRISHPRATIVTPMAPAEPPPRLARSYPRVDGPATSRWGTSLGLDMPRLPRDDDSSLAHTVVDGDTLGALAEHYLGDAGRLMEIYELNRNVLANPDVLPIGARLKIPPRRPQPPAETAAGSPRPLVRIPTAALHHGRP